MFVLQIFFRDIKNFAFIEDVVINVSKNNIYKCLTADNTAKIIVNMLQTYILLIN